MQVTSTPSRRSAPNLSSMLAGLDTSNGAGSANGGDDLTAELDLSDPCFGNGSGGGGGSDMSTIPLEDSLESSAMFTPRSNSRVVRIISKQSNV